jgi:3-dehydroquinate dehydratase II
MKGAGEPLGGPEKFNRERFTGRRVIPMKILVLHGPNLSLLGKREPGLYGTCTLDEIDQRIRNRAQELGGSVHDIFQSNSESELIDKIHAAAGRVDGILFNPAGYTHTSVALRDALLATGIPFVEVHLSNVHSREPFRKISFFSDIALGVVSGFGPESYTLGLEGLVRKIQMNPSGMS